MIKNFKAFKLLTESSIESDLIDQFDSNYIEEYYKKHHKVGIEGVIEMSSHQNIMYFFDSDKYKEDWVKDYIDSYEFEEFDDYDLKSYIKKKIDDDKKNKILEIYNNNNYDEDDEESEKDTEYNEYMLDELDKYELREVIEDSNEEYECTVWIIENWYSGQDGKDIFDEFNGLSEKDGSYGNYKYGSFVSIDSSKLYKMISNYIDDDKLKKDYIDNEDYSYKKEIVEGDIAYSKVLQRYLIKNDPDNVTALIDLWNENNGKNIGDEYDFQKAYINKYLKDGIEEDEDEEDEEKYKTIDDEESDKENKTTLIENALEFLHDNFEVNDKIADEYEPYMWKIIAQYKYNL